MSNGQRVDGDDMTYWWQALGDAGHFTVAEDGIGVSYLDSNTGDAPKLYGTMTGGEVKGVAIADVPADGDRLRNWWRAVTGNGNGYETSTPDKRLGEYLWHIASTITELNDKLIKQNIRITELEQRLDEMEADS